ncbi:hypothetical protein GCM10023339_19140 [Alloalcanivorax gelatiniphagus]
MGTVILIGTVAILVAIVGCFFIWRIDAERAEEVEHQLPPEPRVGDRARLEGVRTEGPKHLGT